MSQTCLSNLTLLLIERTLTNEIDESHIISDLANKKKNQKNVSNSIELNGNYQIIILYTCVDKSFIKNTNVRKINYVRRL